MPRLLHNTPKGFLFLFSPLLLLIFLNGCTPEKTEPNRPETGKAVYDFPENKTWKHRVNSLEEIKQAQHYFSGFELDVFFDSLQLENIVKHDLEDSSTVNLITYFQSFDDLDNKYFWIDIKDLHWDNIAHFYDRHVLVDSLFGIGDRIIYESYNIQTLKRLKEMGLNTSFWVPKFEYTLSDTALCNQKAEKIYGILKTSQHNALSAHYSMLPFLNTYFPESNIHLWTNGLYKEEDIPAIQEILSFESTKVVLIDYDRPIKTDKN